MSNDDSQRLRDTLRDHIEYWRVAIERMEKGEVSYREQDGQGSRDLTQQKLAEYRELKRKLEAALARHTAGS